jgi:hypothetical protein
MIYSAVDSMGVDKQPQEWGSPGMVVYVYGFMFIGNIMLLNMFIGFAIDNFRQIKEELDGFKELNMMQRDWVEMQKFMQRKKLRMIFPEPENGIRRIIFLIVKNMWFDIGSFLLIGVNTVILGVNFDRHNTDNDSIDVLNQVYLGFFHLEVIFKMLASGMFYFKDSWNS